MSFRCAIAFSLAALAVSGGAKADQRPAHAAAKTIVRSTAVTHTMTRLSSAAKVPSANSGHAVQAKPVVQTKAVVQARPIVQTKAVAQAAPVVQAGPVATPAVVQAKPTVQTPDVAEAELVVQTPDVIQTPDVAQAEPVVQTPVAQAKPVVPFNPVVQVKVAMVTPAPKLPAKADEKIEKTEAMCVRPVGKVETGTAAWYGGTYIGRRTTSGSPLDTTHLTAAHRTLPLNSLARVTNLQNGRAVLVRVTDRGPISTSLLIDMSPRAADELQMKHAGLVPVRVEPVVEVAAASK